MSGPSFRQVRRPPDARTADRARQHRNVEVVLRRETGPDRRLRLGRADLRLAGRPRAGANRCRTSSSTARSIDPGIAAASRGIVGDPARGEEWARYAQGILDDVAARVARIPARAPAAGLLRRGPRGLDTGLAGSINMESIERIGAQRRRGIGQGRTGAGFGRAGAGVGPGRDRDDRPHVLREPLARSAVAGLKAVQAGKVSSRRTSRTAGSTSRLRSTASWAALAGDAASTRMHSPRICGPSCASSIRGPTIRRRPGAADALVGRPSRAGGDVGRTGLAVAGALALLAVAVLAAFAVGRYPVSPGEL